MSPRGDGEGIPLCMIFSLLDNTFLSYSSIEELSDVYCIAERNMRSCLTAKPLTRLTSDIILLATWPSTSTFHVHFYERIWNTQNVTSRALTKNS